MKIERVYTHNETVNEWRIDKIFKMADEPWCNVDKAKFEDILYSYPLDFIVTYSSPNGEAVFPKYHFYNIKEYLDFIIWLEEESIFYYLGIPAGLERKIEEFRSWVDRYIKDWKFYYF